MTRSNLHSVDEAGNEPADSPQVLPRVQHVSLQDRVYGELRDAIRAGRFTAGEVMTIRGLADMLGTSTMPVRGAVNCLVLERTLEMLPNRTLRVPPLSLARFDELSDVRATLEGHASARAAEHVTDEEYNAIRDANRRMQDAIDRGDIAAVLPANQQFHFGIYRAARSDLLLATIDNLWQQSGPYIAAITRLSFGSTERGEDAVELMIGHHYEAVAALGRRDPEAARRAIETDIQHSARLYRAMIFGKGVEQ